MPSRKRRNSDQDESGRDVKSVKKETKTLPKPKVTAEPKPTPKQEDKLIIALDFGTTFSGIAYSFQRQQEPKVDAITNWPGAAGQAVPKIPTLISYSDYGRSFKWGASVVQMQGDSVPVKLLLDPSQAKPLYLPSANYKRIINNLPKPPVEIAADFIGAVYKHALEEISKTVPKDYLESCLKEFVVTVPAIWSDLAKDVTRKAAEMAGMSPVTMIKEPEAAALYTMHSLDVALRVGDAFVLCDAGGGTVDLITYEVVGLAPVLELKEVVPGTGGMAGSLGLNQRFGEAVRTLVGEDKFVELRKTTGYRMAMETFDRDVKRRFNGDAEEEYIISFPMADLEDDEDEGVRANCWAIKGKDLNEIFDPLIIDILRLLDDQVKSTRFKRGTDSIRGIFLVGGFGGSQLLKSRIEKQFPAIEVMQPTEAWAAVVKGAVLSNYPTTVAVRGTSATKNYGFRISYAFDAENDAGTPTYLSYNGTRMVRKVWWFIKIGDDVQRDREIRREVVRNLRKNYQLSDLVFTSKLMECSDLDVPTYYSNEDGRVSMNCSLTWDFQSVPDWQDKLSKRYKGDGDFYFTIPPVYLVIEMKSAVMSFFVEVDGEKVASIQAQYE